MFFNYRSPLLLFILSFVVAIIGFAFRVMHWAGGRLITGSMLMVQAIAIIWLIIILASKRGNRE